MRTMTAFVATVVAAGVFCVHASAENSPNLAGNQSVNAVKPGTARQKSIKRVRDRNIKARAASGIGRTNAAQAPPAAAATARANKLQDRNMKAQENSKVLGTGGGTGLPASGPAAK